MTRKEFLMRSLGLAGAAVVGTTLLESCGGAEKKVACDSTEGLAAGEIQKRESMKYVSVSVESGKSCANCMFFTPPAAGSECGACQLFAGGVRPTGFCATWAQKA